MLMISWKHIGVDSRLLVSKGGNFDSFEMFICSIILKQ